MSTYNLSSNMSDRINFDQMVERTLADALEAYGTVGQWNLYFDLDGLGVDDQDEAAARIAAIWPEVEEGEEYRKPASANTKWHELPRLLRQDERIMNNATWSDVLGNDASALEVYRQFTSETLPPANLADWIERKSHELWGNEHNPDMDYGSMADNLREAAALEALRLSKAIDNRVPYSPEDFNQNAQKLAAAWRLDE